MTGGPHKSAFLVGLAGFTSAPAFAQQATPEAVGAGMGLVAGLLISIVVGAIIGWIASLIVKGSGSGLLVDILVGIGGSMLASFVLPALGISFGGSAIGGPIAAILGAVVLLLVVKFLRRG